jgi:hypothetical protein
MTPYLLHIFAFNEMKSYYVMSNETYGEGSGCSLFQTKLLKRIEDITNPRQNKMCPS